MSKTKQKRWRWQHTRHLQYIYLLIMATAIIVPISMTRCNMSTITNTPAHTSSAAAAASTVTEHKISFTIINKTLTKMEKYSVIKTNQTKMSISVNDTLNILLQHEKQYEAILNTTNIKRKPKTENLNNRPVNTEFIKQVNKTKKITALNSLEKENKKLQQHQIAFKSKFKSTSSLQLQSESSTTSNKINDNHFTSYSLLTSPPTSSKHSLSHPRLRRYSKHKFYSNSSTSNNSSSLPVSLGLWQQQYLKVNQVFENERVSSRTSNLQQNRGKIVLLGLFELSTKTGPRPEGLSELIAAQMAVEHINSKQLLPGYTLELMTNDTQVGKV